MVDNFSRFKIYIMSRHPDFDNNQDLYYVIELISDDTGQCFKLYYVNTIDEVKACESEIKTVCKKLKLSAYFSVCAKSKSQAITLLSNKCNATIAEHLLFSIVHDAYINENQVDNIVVIDLNNDFDLSDIFRVKTIIQQLGSGLFITTVSDVCGVHVLTLPFDMEVFNDKCLSEIGRTPEVFTNHKSLLFSIL